MACRDWALAPGPLVDDPPTAGMPPEGGAGGAPDEDDEDGKGPPPGTGPVAGCGMHWDEPCNFPTNR